MTVEYIDPDDLPAYLLSKYGGAYSIAREAEVSTQYAYNILCDGKLPSRKILPKFKLKMVYEVQK